MCFVRIEKLERSRSDRMISEQFDEQFIEREDDKVLAGLDKEARFEFQAVETALARVDNFFRGFPESSKTIGSILMANANAGMVGEKAVRRGIYPKV
ncbi:MAG: hypothetical protein JJ956_06670 [Pseudomonadales bacterium]|nr:hypothetical protein [Pseudomonadales bacterium]